MLGGIDEMRKWMEVMPLKNYELFKIGAPFFFEWLEHPSYDSYWQKIDIENHHSKINVPALNFGGWYDIFQGGTIRNYAGMHAHGAGAAAREGARLLMGPWAHTIPMGNMVGEVDYGYRAASISIDLDSHALKFFDRHLKGIEKGTELPPVRLFVMGTNRWRDENEWPLARTNWQRYYLHSRGRANSASGDGELSTQAPGHEPPDAFLYNPLDPTPTRGGGLCCYAAVVPGGAYDQSAIEARPDVLVYSTQPLTEDVEVVGPISLTLYASSSAPDTDFTAKLVDVDRLRMPLPQSDRRHHPRTLPRIALAAGPADARQGLRIHNRYVVNRQCLQSGTSDQAGGKLEQLPALRPQPQHRARPVRRRRNAPRAAIRDASERDGVVPDAAGDPRIALTFAATTAAPAAIVDEWTAEVVRLGLRWRWGVFCGPGVGLLLPFPIQCHGGRSGWGCSLCASVIAAGSSMVRCWSKCASCASIRPKLKQSSATACAGASWVSLPALLHDRRLHRRLPLS